MEEGWLDGLCRQRLRSLEDQSLLRQRRALDIIDSTHVCIDGQRLVNFASNNYLGLTHHPRVLSAAAEAARDSGLGSGASALVSGHTNLHARAESALAAWKGTQAAVLLPSGYQSSAAVVQTLSSLVTTKWPGVRYLLDKLSHASLIDAVQATGQPFRIFPHNNIEKLERLLAEAPMEQAQVVITESIFSMDGDPADLTALAALKRKHRFALVLDEAHGSGVYGPAGSGYAAEVGLGSLADVTIVTLSKALGAAGGAVCASRAFCDAMTNLGRSSIFTTSIPPSIAAAVMAALDVLREEPGRQTRVRALARHVRATLAAAGFSIPAGDSPIIPIILGSEQSAMSAAAQLREAGLLTVAIRPPTVPRGTSRLRITLSCDHTDEEIDRLIAALRQVTLPHLA